MTKYGLLIDLELCTGCKACMTVCKGNHNIPYGEYEGREYYRIWPVEKEMGSYPYVIRNMTPWLCMQCADPPCVKACPVSGALHQRDDGIVEINKSLCDGCCKCLTACPYGALYFRQDQGVVDKCDLCLENINEGSVPECVKACPTEAIIFGDIEDSNSKISKTIQQKQAMPLHPEYHTGPNVFYTAHVSRLKGTVIDSESGEAIIGANILLKSKDLPSILLRTDRDGVLFAWNLRNCTQYSIQITANGFQSYINEITVKGEYHDIGLLKLDKK
jgi:tetrathionate reductase subunit B